ncbi:hypothetical protein BX666DRAFT_221007 [Dichotomocladium elegans]|nr:hypothetical protein BX666DRAFT_221007 [Dichotomocladium elegans]
MKDLCLCLFLSLWCVFQKHGQDFTSPLILACFSCPLDGSRDVIPVEGGHVMEFLFVNNSSEESKSFRWLPLWPSLPRRRIMAWLLFGHARYGMKLQECLRSCSLFFRDLWANYRGLIEWMGQRKCCWYLQCHVQ